MKAWEWGETLETNENALWIAITGQSGESGMRGKGIGSCLLWVMSTETSVDIAADIAVDSRSTVGR